MSLVQAAKPYPPKRWSKFTLQQRNPALTPKAARVPTAPISNSAKAATPPQRNAKHRQQCEAKQQRIQKIDELARKGGSVQQMERLREERQKARDWQFRAGC